MTFIGRMVQHILPKGFQRIRYYGLQATKTYEKWAERISVIQWDVVSMLLCSVQTAVGSLHFAALKQRPTRHMMHWRHSGFSVYCGRPIWPHDEQGLENLARYVIRASFSEERMRYLPASECSDGVAKVLLPVQERGDVEDLRCVGLAGPTGHPHPEPGGTDGALLRVLQQQVPRDAQESRYG